MNFISICSIFRNEADYLKDWIEFHQKIGVEKFILYNDHSTDHFMDVLSPFISNQTVSLIDHKDTTGARQMTSYAHYVVHFDKDSVWSAYIDVDEFLYPTKDSLPQTLKNKNNQKAVVANWVCFFSKDLLYSNEPIWLRSKHRTSFDFSWNKHVKLLVQKDTIQYFYNPHAIRSKNNLPIFDNQNNIIQQDGQNLQGALMDIDINNYLPDIKIHHYYIKSKEEFQNKMINGWKQMKDKSQIENMFNILTRDSNILDNSPIITF
jgi:hypothetical protein